MRKTGEPFRAPGAAEAIQPPRAAEHVHERAERPAHKAPAGRKRKYRTAAAQEPLVEEGKPARKAEAVAPKREAEREYERAERPTAETPAGREREHRTATAQEPLVEEGKPARKGYFVERAEKRIAYARARFEAAGKRRDAADEEVELRREALERAEQRVKTHERQAGASRRGPEELARSIRVRATAASTARKAELAAEKAAAAWYQTVDDLADLERELERALAGKRPEARASAARRK